MKSAILKSLIIICFTLSLPSLVHAQEDNLFSDFGRKLKERLQGDSSNVANMQEAQAEALEDKRPESTSSQARPEDGAVDMKQLVQNIQLLLAKHGFDAGVADGISGEKTRDAICHYQAVHGLGINPKPTIELLNHLQQSGLSKPRDLYTSLIKHQCNIAHINNLNNIEAVENHNYEGTLTADDLMCREVVSPFGLVSNIEVLFGSFSDKVFGIFSRKDKEEKLEQFREEAKKANWMPLNMEISYGEQIHNQRMEQAGKILNRDNKRHDVRMLYKNGDATLDRLLSAIGEEFPYQFKLFIVDDRSVNAEAIPGGYLYVNSGVFNTDYTDLVVAHELAHVLRRHTTKELQARLIDTAETTEDLKKLMKGGSKNAVAMLEKVLLLHGAIVQYSKQQELQSDACAVRLALRAQLPQLDHYINAYIADIEKDHMEISKKASSHPAYAERKTRMMAVYEEAKAVRSAYLAENVRH